MGKIIKVAPQQLKASAQKINVMADTFEEIYKKLLQQADMMGSAWEGSDNLAYVEKIHTLSTKLNQMTQKLRIGSETLAKQAQNYDDQRADNIAKINNLNN